jgi:hypothetical protein
MLASQEAVLVPLNKGQFLNFAHIIAVISDSTIAPVMLKVTKQCSEDLL